jgi:iron complex transport system substrate-binding protein
MAERIVSLLPSATEIVCALGLVERLVGVSHECDYPLSVLGRPVLTEPKINAGQSSAAIDRDVRKLVRDGLSVYRIKTDVLENLRPDLIITQDQCEVCAVSFPEVERAVRASLGEEVDILSLRPSELEDVLGDIERVAAAGGRSNEGAALLDRMRARLAAIRERAKRVHSRPRVACIEWMEPLMIAGNWIPELVLLGGGSYDMVRPGGHSHALSWPELAAYAPDVVIVMPCGFKLSRTQAEMARLTGQPEWPQLPAVRNRRVYLADGSAYLNRPGPRIVESAELLAGLIQPGFFAADMPPDSWARLD